ncbi:hypothetical protein ABC347_14835 [Sphingomonas sp. 1P06PA]|uniref:hypothetical protein n=1 Tax=Sphingomonas sp. 1P06PA TaxID=554121 RepID=UPI0039A655CD
MDRAERNGFAIAAAGHIALFGALSVGLLTTPKPLPKISEPVDVQLVDAIGLRSEAPVLTQEAPAPSVAPEIGPPEEAAPAAPEPEPLPPPPKPTPAPPAPAPPAPARKPVPAPKPVPKPVAKPAPKPAAPAKPAPKAPATPPKATPAKAAPARPTPAKAAPASSAGSGTRPKAAGGSIGDDFLKGITPEKSAGKAQTPRAAAVGQAQMNGLAAAIKRQVQPCYERKGIVGPGAERIITVLRLRFDPDGTLTARPTRSEQTGVDDENRRYATRAAEVAIASVMECTPLKLPAELYENGWRDIEAGFSQIAAR